MLLHRLVAFPESTRILRRHLIATPFLAIQMASVMMIPVILRRDLGASEWQTVVSTASIPMMHLLSIFWVEIYRRMRPDRYLLLLWFVAIVPLGLIALCHRPATVLVFVMLSALGFGAMHPVGGDILRSCYPPTARSRVYALLQSVNVFMTMAGAYGIGIWLHDDNAAWRIYLPASVVVIGVGMAILAGVTHQPLFAERHQSKSTEPLATSLRQAWRSMLDVFRDDPQFRRYEAAFFIYGLGWMIGNALLPFLVVDKLELNHEEVARSTQLTFQFTLLVMLLPAGWLMERLGPMRLASWGFAALTLWPIGLILARDTHSLTVVTVWYGIAMTAVHLAWTIGPVTLAKDASRAAHYLAIHATLVGGRAVIAQFAAVALYYFTRSLSVPLAMASVTFAVGAVMMMRLERERRAAIPVLATVRTEPM